MKNGNEDIHRLLDGDVPAGDKEAIIKQIQDDPVLRKEFDDLGTAVELLEREGRMQPPLAFTASVMGKLPRPADPLPARLKRFLFGSRVLRWNMAAALAIALLTVVTALLMMRQITHIGTDPASRPSRPANRRQWCGSRSSPRCQERRRCRELQQVEDRQRCHEARERHVDDRPSPEARCVHVYVHRGP